MITKRIVVTITFVAALIAILTSYLLSCGYISEKAAKDTISNYLYTRYDNVSESNLEESYEQQNKYYSRKLIEETSWVNAAQNVNASKEYFNSYHFYSNVLSLVIEPYAENKYTAKVFVLYASTHPEYDNLVTYEFRFTVTKALNNIYLDEIEVITNEMTYINGGELHLHDGEVTICYDYAEEYIN